VVREMPRPENKHATPNSHPTDVGDDILQPNYGAAPGPRGIDFGALALSILAPISPWWSIRLIPIALLALRGCPIIWAMGLFVTIAMHVHARHDTKRAIAVATPAPPEPTDAAAATRSIHLTSLWFSKPRRPRALSKSGCPLTIERTQSSAAAGVNPT
jgi:hypothetical protein